MILKEKLVLTYPAVEESFREAGQRMEEILEKYEAPIKVQHKVAIAFEEMFINVCRYAYDGGTGNITTEIRIYEPGGEETGGKCVRITLTDSGTPYDPLAKEDPDITLSAEERGIGGLGIYMVKKSMDNVSYEYMDGRNIFTMEKAF